jgi:undecaprenyl-diphosphatase
MFLGFILILGTQDLMPIWFDAGLHRLALAHTSLWLTAVAVWVTTLGYGVTVPVTVAAHLLLAEGGWLERVRWMSLATAVLLAGLLVRLAVAEILARPRPPATDWLAGAGGYAFPSGHTSAATIAAGLVLWGLARRRTKVPAAAWLMSGAIAYALAVGLTRIWLGVHWPTDVLGGWAFGVAWVSACVLMTGAVSSREESRSQHEEDR